MHPTKSAAPILCAIALLCSFAAHAAAPTSLSADEQKIVAAVKAHAPEALQLLKRAVLINSGTMNANGVRDVGDVFRAELNELGFNTRWSEMPAEMQRAGHLIATRSGTQGKRVLLIGHLDTVFERDSTVPLWAEHGERVRGQGVNDMKGGDVIIIEALRALQQAGLLDNTRIEVIFSGDEEEAGAPKSISRADLVDAARRNDVALAFENTIGTAAGDTATIGRRATATWELEVKGKQGHSAMVFGPPNGYGAIYETARILNAFREQVPEPEVTFNPGFIVGGTDVGYDSFNSKGTAFGKTNVIANSTRVKGDLRYLTAEQRERAHQKMQAIVAQNLAGTSASIVFQESYPPMSPTAGNLRLLEQYSKASDDAGLGPIVAVPPGQRGAGDVQFVAPYVDSLDGLGAAGRGAHSPDEELEVASLERAAIRTAVLLYRLTR